jgi:phospholipase D1/2
MKAQSGVIINILLYHEIRIAAQGNDSASAQAYLESLHPNICCQRHGCGLADGLQWSHHEKLVIIDRNIAFVGGIDIAFHRWDDEKHQLFDIKRIKFPGKEYSQPAQCQYGNSAGKV